MIPSEIHYNSPNTPEELIDIRTGALQQLLDDGKIVHFSQVTAFVDGKVVTLHYTFTPSGFIHEVKV